MDPIAFSKKIIDTCKKEGCEGVSISGGEPFQQSRALGMLTNNIREGGLTVICYTGYSDSAIFNSKDKDIAELLQNIDVLITGPFNPNDDKKCVWIDNTHKRILFLTDAYSKKDFQSIPSVEYVIDNRLFGYSGFPEDDTVKNLLLENL